MPATALQKFQASFQAERERWRLWVPVLFGCGIILYFSLPFEPSLALASRFLALTITAALLARRLHFRFLLPLLILLTIAGAGFTTASWRAARVQSPVITDNLGVIWVRATVQTIEEREHGTRVLLKNLDLWQPEKKQFPPEETPLRVRLNIRTAGMENVRPGDAIQVKAILNPPPRYPAYPGGYDFARHAYFQRIGAVGYSVSPITVRTPATEPGLERLRHTITERILKGMGGKETPAAPIAAALVTGDQGAIDKEIYTAMYNTGVGHILSISGLHMAIVMGGCFFLVRAMLALMPFIALRYAIKKWAAVSAILVGIFYLLISGSSVPAERSTIMAGLFFLAIIFDRIGTPMLPIAWAALIVLILSPEELMGPSLQMSFASVVALIAAFQYLHDFRQKRRSLLIAPPSFPRRFVTYMFDMTLSSFVAGMATAPFAIYHFGRYSNYSVPANLLAIPLTSFWVMPWCMFSLLLMPFGLERLALIPAKWGLDIFIDFANYFNSLPHIIILVPYIAAWVLGVFSLGGVWLCFWRTRMRYLGVPLMLLALGCILLPPRGADVLVSEDGKMFAVRDAEGQLVFSSLKYARYARSQWLRMNAQEEPLRAKDSDILNCNAEDTACSYAARGHSVAFLQEESAFAETCAHAEIWVNLASAAPCPSAKISITGDDLAANGTYALWLDNPPAIRSAGSEAGARFWTSAR